MNLNSIIESAELQFKQVLEDYFISVYNENSLPSHGLEHHRRVWNYAKELTANIFKKNRLTDSSLPLNLIIACYLHDIGMSVDPGIKHGHHSKELCKNFLFANNLKENKFQSLLSAIENHDNKEYKTSTSKYDLITILSVADDLDAFGYAGIYRYSEIYLKRGIDHKVIGHSILINAEQRFNNFINIFGANDSIVLKHRERYIVLKEFFNNYNSQVQSYNFDGHNPTGYCGVIELVLKMTEGEKGLKELFTELENNSDDEVIKWFFKGLYSEL